MKSRQARTLVGILLCGLLLIIGGIQNHTLQLRTSTTNSQVHLAYEQSRSNVSSSQRELITGKLLVAPSDRVMGKRLDSFSPSTGEALIWLYQLTARDLIDHLADLAHRGIRIRMILENRKFQEFGSDFKKLVDRLSGSNFQIRSDQELGTNYVHSKVFVTDKQFIIQTANLSFSSFTKNREYFFVSSHSGVLTSLHNIFQKDRKAQPLEVKDLHPNLVVCPLNCRSVIEYLISNAQKSIVIQTQYITDPDLKNLLASKNNLKRRILVSDTKDNILLRQFLGSEIVRLQPKPYVHAKMILIDDSILLLGSMNLSTNSLDRNREHGIIITDSQTIREFMSIFESDWKNSNIDLRK